MSIDLYKILKEGIIKETNRCEDDVCIVLDDDKIYKLIEELKSRINSKFSGIELDSVRKSIEEFPALAHVGSSIIYNDDCYIEKCLKEDRVYDELKNKWVEEFEKITDSYEDYIIKVIGKVLGEPIVLSHNDNEFVMEFLETQNKDEEKKLWDVITSLGCNIERLSSDDTTYRFIVRELSDNMVEDRHGLFSIFIDGIEFRLPLTNQYIYENI